MWKVEGMEEQAKRIVRESRYTLSTIGKDDIHYDLPIGHICRTIVLPIRLVTEGEYRSAKRKVEAIHREYDLNGLAAGSPDSYPLLLKDRVAYSIQAGIVYRWQVQQESENLDMEIHCVRLGDTVIITNACELFQDYGMQMMARSQAKQTIVAQICCGHFGYLPTKFSMTGVGYGANVTDQIIDTEGGDILVDKSLELIELLYH